MLLAPLLPLSPSTLTAALLSLLWLLETVLDPRNHDDAVDHRRPEPAVRPLGERGLRPGFHLWPHGLAEPVAHVVSPFTRRSVCASCLHWHSACRLLPGRN